MHWENTYFEFRISIWMNWRWLISQNKWEQHFLIDWIQFRRKCHHTIETTVYFNGEHKIRFVLLCFFFHSSTQTDTATFCFLFSIVLCCVVFMSIKCLSNIYVHSKSFKWEQSKMGDVLSLFLGMLYYLLLYKSYCEYKLQMKSILAVWMNVFDNFVTFDERPISRKSLVNSNISSKIDTH